MDDALQFLMVVKLCILKYVLGNMLPCYEPMSCDFHTHGLLAKGTATKRESEAAFD
jgi:hypothetical protein